MQEMCMWLHPPISEVLIVLLQVLLALAMMSVIALGNFLPTTGMEGKRCSVWWQTPPWPGRSGGSLSTYSTLYQKLWTQS